MLKSKPVAETSKTRNFGRAFIVGAFLLTFIFSVGCRYDMQDQPRYKQYKASEFFGDGKAMQDPPEGTVARGQLRENKALYTGKKEGADLNAPVESTTDAMGNTIVSSFPNDVEELPIPMTRELLERGEQRYRVFCIVCHGPVGKGDGMVVRRGYPQPTTYHDDRLRNAPVGHFFDVITNGWGKMNGYASQIPVADRWAIVAYIRALQASQNPNANAVTPASTTNTNETKTDGTQESTSTEPAANGGAK